MSAGLQALTKPARALLRRAVREAVGRHASLRQAIVADRRRGADALVDVAGVEQILLVGSDVPHAGEAIRRELELHRERIRAGSAPAALLRLLHLPIDAEQILDVMTDFVRDDVSLREITGRAESPIELTERTRDRDTPF
jgi:hypothetical protein